MGLIFRRDHIDAILEGRKTQTRRRHAHPLKAGKVYDVNKDWYHSTGHRILVTRVRRQRLGDVTPGEARAEGGYSVEEFREAWRQIYGGWDPDEEVVVYEFKLLENRNQAKLNGLNSKKDG
jgi:hypothetical protein